jgi:hypothetical protein
MAIAKLSGTTSEPFSGLGGVRNEIHQRGMYLARRFEGIDDLKMIQEIQKDILKGYKESKYIEHFEEYKYRAKQKSAFSLFACVSVR